jgi:hypothetical protein
VTRIEIELPLASSPWRPLAPVAWPLQTIRHQAVSKSHSSPRQAPGRIEHEEGAHGRALAILTTIADMGSGQLDETPARRMIEEP